MDSAVADPPVKKRGMAKKKPTGGKHSTLRVNVGVPEPWHSLLRRIAAANRQPVLYAIITLAKAEAERLGLTDIPTAPWEVGGEPADDA